MSPRGIRGPLPGCGSPGLRGAVDRLSRGPGHFEPARPWPGSAAARGAGGGSRELSSRCDSGHPPTLGSGDRLRILHLRIPLPGARSLLRYSMMRADWRLRAHERRHRRCPRWPCWARVAERSTAWLERRFSTVWAGSEKAGSWCPTGGAGRTWAIPTRSFAGRSSSRSRISTARSRSGVPWVGLRATSTASGRLGRSRLCCRFSRATERLSRGWREVRCVSFVPGSGCCTRCAATAGAGRGATSPHITISATISSRSSWIRPSPTPAVSSSVPKPPWRRRRSRSTSGSVERSSSARRITFSRSEAAGGDSRSTPPAGTDAASPPRRSRGSSTSSLSKRIAEAGLADRVEVLLQDYRDLRGSYDKLVSIEMIEAVGHQHFDTYFQVCSERLKSAGMMLLEAITVAERDFSRSIRNVDFVKRYIFPGGQLVSVGAICSSLARATDLRITHLEDITPHYAETLRHWRENMHRESAADPRPRPDRISSCGCGSSISATARPASASGPTGSARSCWRSRDLDALHWSASWGDIAERTSATKAGWSQPLSKSGSRPVRATTRSREGTMVACCPRAPEVL